MNTREILGIPSGGTGAAMALALQAHRPCKPGQEGEINFASRRGTVELENGRVAVYDNNPFARDPDERGRMLAMLIARLAVRGVTLVDSAYYPQASDQHPDDVGHTVALVFDGPGASEALRTEHEKLVELTYDVAPAATLD